MGLFGASRAANRMGARQQYRTMARMQRRRSYMQNAMGTHQDFEHREDEDQYQEAAPAEQDVTQQLEQLADLKSKGVITEEEFTAKKKQLLGI